MNERVAASVPGGVGARRGLNAGAAVALLVLGDGVFGDPPVGRDGGRSVS